MYVCMYVYIWRLFLRHDIGLSYDVISHMLVMPHPPPQERDPPSSLFRHKHVICRDIADACDAARYRRLGARNERP